MKHKEQTYYLFGTILLLAVLYFGFDTKPSSQKALEKSRALNTQHYDIPTLEKEAVKSLKEEEIEFLETLKAQLQHAGQDSMRQSLLKQLSGYWYSLQSPVIAGLYAAEIAKTENTGQAWAIAGTTFAAAFQNAELDQDLKLFAKSKALESFENAISLEPAVIDHRINQALCFIEVPDDSQPMKGIQMLAGLANSYPDSPMPPYHLARLAVRTGQYDRAQTRIEQALNLAPTDPRIACLAIDIYKALNKTTEAEKLIPVCAGK